MDKKLLPNFMQFLLYISLMSSAVIVPWYTTNVKPTLKDKESVKSGFNYLSKTCHRLDGSLAVGGAAYFAA